MTTRLQILLSLILLSLTAAVLAACSSGGFGSRSDTQAGDIRMEQAQKKGQDQTNDPLMNDPRYELLTNDFPLPSGISVPPGTTINIAETTISGISQASTGFVVMESDYAPNTLVNYYGQEMLKNGWQPSGISRGQKNYISFVRMEKNGSTRVASFRITESKGIGGVFGKQGGSNIELFVGESIAAAAAAMNR